MWPRGVNDRVTLCRLDELARLSVQRIEDGGVFALLLTVTIMPRSIGDLGHARALGRILLPRLSLTSRMESLECRKYCADRPRCSPLSLPDALRNVPRLTRVNFSRTSSARLTRFGRAKSRRSPRRFKAHSSPRPAR